MPSLARRRFPKNLIAWPAEYDKQRKGHRTALTLAARKILLAVRSEQAVIGNGGVMRSRMHRNHARGDARPDVWSGRGAVGHGGPNQDAGAAFAANVCVAVQSHVTDGAEHYLAQTKSI